MKVIEYLKEHGLDKLSDEYGILVKKYIHLIVLNYRQMNSSMKFNEIVKECRGLILDYNFNVISRSFDRFFNFFELSPQQQERFKDQNYFKTLKVYEKIDGSLIKIFNFRDVWYISTRKTGYAEGTVVNNNKSDITTTTTTTTNSTPTTFKELVLKALDVKDDSAFQNLCNEHFKKDRTYIFELTSPQNKIITPYEDDYYTLWLLASRQNDDTGVIEFPEYLKNLIPAIKIPPTYTFSSIEECFESAEKLPNLKEGYVVCDGESNNPILKIKSTSYLKAHNRKFFNYKEEEEKEKEELYPKDIIRLIATGGYEEIISNFPEEKIKFEPYLDKIEQYLAKANEIYKKIVSESSSSSSGMNDADDDKEFALKIKSFPFAGLAFEAKKKKKNNILTVYDELDADKKEHFISKRILQPVMIICVGVSGSGKSTFARELAESFGFVDINRDSIRFPSSPLFRGLYGWHNYKFNSENEAKVTEKCLEIWERAKLERKNVIISDCNLKILYQNEWRERGIANSYRVEIKYFPITLEEAWQNDMRRGNLAVGREVLIRQYKKWLKLTNRRQYVPNLENPKAIVCDIDGTIALATDRNIFDYSSSKVLTDKPREYIIDMIQIWANVRNYEVIFVSGRDDSCCRDTRTWITEHVKAVKSNFDLYMRREGDYRKDSKVKEEIFWNFIADRFNVVAIFDDRPQVIRMWNDIGIENVVNVQQGYHEF